MGRGRQWPRLAGGRFFDGYTRNGEHHFPDSNIAGVFVHQVGKDDLSRELAARHGFKICPSVEEALTLGTGTLAVDGVLLIDEHGNYPYNAKAQELYPRYEDFMKVVEVFKKSGRTVPVFCDKHLSYDRKLARDMVNTKRAQNRLTSHPPSRPAPPKSLIS